VLFPVLCVLSLAMTKACLLNLKTNALQCGSARTKSAACFVVHVLQPTFTISSADVSIYVDERARFCLSPMYCLVRVTAQGGVKLTSFQSERKICLYNCQPMFPLVFRKRCLLRSAEKSLKVAMERSSHSTFAALLLIVYTKCGEVEVCVG